MAHLFQPLFVAGDVVEEAIGRKKEPEDANEYNRMDRHGHCPNKHTVSVTTCTRKHDNTRQDFTGVEQGYREVVVVCQSPAPVWLRSQGGGVKSLKDGD